MEGERQCCRIKHTEARASRNIFNTDTGSIPVPSPYRQEGDGGYKNDTHHSVRYVHAISVPQDEKRRGAGSNL